VPEAVASTLDALRHGVSVITKPLFKTALACRSDFLIRVKTQPPRYGLMNRSKQNLRDQRSGGTDPTLLLRDLLSGSRVLPIGCI